MYTVYIIICTTFTPQFKGKPVHIIILHIALTQKVNEGNAYISLSTVLMRYLHQCVYLINLRYCTPNRSAHYLQESDFFDVIL